MSVLIYLNFNCCAILWGGNEIGELAFSPVSYSHWYHCSKIKGLTLISGLLLWLATWMPGSSALSLSQLSCAPDTYNVWWNLPGKLSGPELFFVVRDLNVHICIYLWSLDQHLLLLLFDCVVLYLSNLICMKGEGVTHWDYIHPGCLFPVGTVECLM